MAQSPKAKKTESKALQSAALLNVIFFALLYLVLWALLSISFDLIEYICSASKNTLAFPDIAKTKVPALIVGIPAAVFCEHLLLRLKKKGFVSDQRARLAGVTLALAVAANVLYLMGFVSRVINGEPAMQRGMDVLVLLFVGIALYKYFVSEFDFANNKKTNSTE